MSYGLVVDTVIVVQQVLVVIVVALALFPSLVLALLLLQLLCLELGGHKGLVVGVELVVLAPGLVDRKLNHSVGVLGAEVDVRPLALNVGAILLQLF